MNNFKTCLNEHYVYCNGIIYKELKEALTTIAEENSKEHKDIIMLKINNYRVYFSDIEKLQFTYGN